MSGRCWCDHTMLFFNVHRPSVASLRSAIKSFSQRALYNQGGGRGARMRAAPHNGEWARGQETRPRANRWAHAAGERRVRMDN